MANLAGEAIKEICPPDMNLFGPAAPSGLQGSTAYPVLPPVTQPCLSQAEHQSPHLDLRIFTLLALHQFAATAGGGGGICSRRRQGRGCRGLCHGVYAESPRGLMGQPIVKWPGWCFARDLTCSSCEKCHRQLLGCWRAVKFTKPCCLLWQALVIQQPRMWLRRRLFSSNRGWQA